MVYIISLHRAAGGILPGHGNYVNHHILPPDFSHALRVRLSVKKFSPRAVNIYIYTLIIYIDIHNNLLYIYIHTLATTPTPTLFAHPLACCLAMLFIPLLFRSLCPSVSFLLADILANPFALCPSSQPFRATLSHDIFRRVFSFASCFCWL